MNSVAVTAPRMTSMSRDDFSSTMAIAMPWPLMSTAMYSSIARANVLKNAASKPPSVSPSSDTVTASRSKRCQARTRSVSTPVPATSRSSRVASMARSRSRSITGFPVSRA